VLKINEYFVTFFRILLTSCTTLVMGLYTSSALAESPINSDCQAAMVAGSPAVHQLFDPTKKMAANYESILAGQLSAGDILRFSNGTEFLLINVLGTGFTTLILEVRQMQNGQPYGEKFALRIPSSNRLMGNSLKNFRARTLINKFYDGYDLLVEQGVNVPKLYEHLSEEYNLVEKINFDLNGSDFFLKPGKFAPKLLTAAEEALYEFARSVSVFENIGDFRADQLVYVASENRWILLDWTDNHVLLHERAGGVAGYHHPFGAIFVKYLRETPQPNGTLIERKLTLLRELRILKRIEAIIKAARDRKPGPLVTQPR